MIVWISSSLMLEIVNQKMNQFQLVIFLKKLGSTGTLSEENLQVIQRFVILLFDCISGFASFLL